MDVISAPAVILSVTTALLYAATSFVVRVLPLVSDRANERAVRLAKARRPQSK